MKPALPPGLEAYKQTATFTEATVPAGLLSDHSTKEGVWGLIEVESGELRYLVTDPRRANREQTLVAGGEAGIVEPTILHSVEPVGEVRFHVRFLREPTGHFRAEKGQERNRG